MRFYMWVVPVCMALTAGAAVAGESTAKKVGKGAEQTGKTAVHGTTGVGKGASKIYHEAAKGVHRTIAKNSKSDRTKAKHKAKGAAHDSHARRKAVQSEKEIDRAGQEGKKITNPR